MVNFNKTDILYGFYAVNLIRKTQNEVWFFFSDIILILLLTLHLENWYQLYLLFKTNIKTNTLVDYFQINKNYVFYHIFH